MKQQTYRRLLALTLNRIRRTRRIILPIFRPMMSIPILRRNRLRDTIIRMSDTEHFPLWQQTIDIISICGFPVRGWPNV